MLCKDLQATEEIKSRHGAFVSFKKSDRLSCGVLHQLLHYTVQGRYGVSYS